MGATRLNVFVQRLIFVVVINVVHYFYCILPGDDCNGTLFNGTEGDITTPGFPNRLDFNKTCRYNINVGSGRIALTFTNVSLPDGASIVFFRNALFVRKERIQSRIFYVDSHETSIRFNLHKSNNTDSFKGVKLHYTQVPVGMSAYILQISLHNVSRSKVIIYMYI